MRSVYTPFTPHILPFKKTPRRRVRARRLALAAGVAAAAAAAVGAPASASSGSDEIRPAVPEQMCDGIVALNGATVGFPEDPADIAFYVEDQLLPAVDVFIDEVDSDWHDAAHTLRTALVAVGETGDPGALFTPDTLVAQTMLASAVHSGCELEAVDVLATDYAFGGLPETLTAGRVSIAFVNDGGEEHELLLVRRPDDSTATLDEYMHEAPSDSAPGWPANVMMEGEFMTVVWAAPGETGYTAVDLDPGTYFAICLIPTGGDENAEPHADHGMIATLVVEPTA